MITVLTPYLINSLCLFISIIVLVISGYIVRSSLKKTLYGVCLYAIILINVILFAYCLAKWTGVITPDGNYSPVIGVAFEWIINNVFETGFAFKILYAFFVVIAVNGIFLFLVTGLTGCLPLAKDRKSSEDIVSSTSRAVIWYSAMFYSKSFASVAAFFLATGIFCLFYGFFPNRNYSLILWSGAMFCLSLSAAVIILCVFDYYINALGDDEIFFGDELFQKLTKLRLCCEWGEKLIRTRLNQSKTQAVPAVPGAAPGCPSNEPQTSRPKLSANPGRRTGRRTN